MLILTAKPPCHVKICFSLIHNNSVSPISLQFHHFSFAMPLKDASLFDSLLGTGSISESDTATSLKIMS